MMRASASSYDRDRELLRTDLRAVKDLKSHNLMRGRRMDF